MTSLVLQLSYPTHRAPEGTTTHTAELTIIDSVSRVRMATIELTPAQLLDLMASRDIEAPAVVPDGDVLSRVGKTLHTAQVVLGRDHGRDGEAAAMDEAMGMRMTLPALWSDAPHMSVSVRWERAGWVAIYRCWIDETAASAPEENEL